MELYKIKGICQTYGLNSKSCKKSEDEKVEYIRKLWSIYGKEKVLNHCSSNIDWYKYFDDNPYRSTFNYCGMDYDEEYMKNYIDEHRADVEECNRLYCTYNKKKNVFASVCNYSFGVGIYDNVAHSDYAQLYPNILLRCMKGETLRKYEYLLDISLKLKERIKNETDDNIKSILKSKRNIHKLMCNSYWGYASNMNKLFKDYVLSAEKVEILKMTKCYKKVYLIKTDGVFGVPYTDTKERLSMLDIKCDYDKPDTLLLWNIGNYRYGNACSGALMFNSTMQLPSNLWKGIDDEVCDYRHLNGDIVKFDRNNYDTELLKLVQKYKERYCI